VFFYFLWLSVSVPAVISGDTPREVLDAGVSTNPVHVIDMALFLPAMLVAGVALLKRRAIGYVLAPVVLGAAFVISLGIITIQPVLAARGEDPAWGVGAGIAVAAAVELTVLVRFLRSGRSERLPLT
jgi:hypothetical protein